MKIGNSAGAALHVVVLPALMFSQVRTPEPIKTTVCELLKSPETFNGQMVQVRATVASSFEWGGLVDKRCDGHLLSDDDGFSALSGRTGQYAFFRLFAELEHPEKLAWRRILLPPPIRIAQDAPYREYEKFVLEKFKRTDGSRCFECPLFEITVTVVGRFDHLEQQMVAIRDKANQKPTPYMAGFGHLNASLNRLVWQSVSDVEAKPIDPSIYEKRK
jgi:hypothetical protein